VRNANAARLPGLVLIFLSLTFSAGAETLTFEQCVREATLNNPGLRAAEQEIQRTEAVRKGAYSPFLPQVTLSSEVSRSRNEQTTVSGGTSFGTPTSSSQYGNSYMVQLQLQQRLFDGFSTKGQIDKARAEIGVATAKLLTEKALVSFELKSAFAQMLYAQELQHISKNILEQRELNARMVGLKYENGRENKGALLLSRANVTQASTDIIQAGRTLELSRIQLVNLMGRTKVTPFNGKGQLATAPPEVAPDYAALALLTPAHFQQDAVVKAANSGITIARSTFYPQINAYFSTSSQSESALEMPQSWQAGLNGSWAVFDGTATYFNVRAARANLESQRSGLRQTDADTTSSLAEDHRSLCDAIENVKVGAELLDAAALRAKIAEAQYRNGLISFQDFDTITNDHINRQKSHLQSRRDAVLAEAQWEESRGTGAIP
jgi:outer membrane protein